MVSCIVTNSLQGQNVTQGRVNVATLQEARFPGVEKKLLCSVSILLKGVPQPSGNESSNYS